MNRNVPIVLSLVLLVGIIAPAYGQTISDNVVINEVDTNPPGNDAESVSEWVEIYNPTDSAIDIGGWKIASTTVLKKTFTISDGTIIKPGKFLTFSYQTVWFTDSSESVELRDENGVVIDKTPMITDIQNDFTSWQRIYDGYDLDSQDDWKFVTSTAGSTNGKLIETQESGEISVTISSDKSSYLFGEVATITGTVSKIATPEKPEFKPKPILVNFTGPNFFKTVTLYPDLKQNYKTTLSLHQVLGVNEGAYDVTVYYADATATTNFSVGFEIIEQEIVEEGSFSVSTNSSQYLPGQFVTIVGTATDIIPFTGMQFTITDSKGKTIESGNLFPTDGEFKTQIFVTTVNPTFGTYEIIAEYFDKSAKTTFEVVEDFKETVPISLWTDKDVYGLGDEVKITGRVNQVWVGTLDLNIVSTKQSGIVTSTTQSTSGFKVQKSLTVLGDGSFSSSFKLPFDSSKYGDYKITVSKDLGKATKIIHLVENPDTFVVLDEPMTINFDKELYNTGDKMTISGFIKNPFGNSSYETASTVKISVSNEDGSPLEILGLPKEFQGESRTENGVLVALEYTAIPSTSGSYSVQIDIANNIFPEGNYVAKAEYFGNIVSKAFSVKNPLDLKDGAVITLDKEVYGLGETVNLTGLIPPTGTRSADISLIKPDGSAAKSSVPVDSQQFTWSWTIPGFDVYQNTKTDEVRNVIKSNFGIYKIKISLDSIGIDTFFKVSEDPENDSLSTDPLFVTTEKSLYKAGEKLKITGNVIKRDQGDEGLVIPERVHLSVIDGSFPYPQIYDASVYPNQGGEFSSVFELPITVFAEGSYTVKAFYTNLKAEATFGVTNDFAIGVDEPVSILLSTDKSEYFPGDIVLISGKPNKLVYFEKYDVSVIQKAETEITCGSFICGIHAGPITSLFPSPTGSFEHLFVIPDSVSAIGTYEITVDADFDTKHLKFNVVEKPSSPKLSTIIEKENRITDPTIPILTKAAIVDDISISPRVMSGTLLTSTRADDPNVHVKVTSKTGVCIIGQDMDCLVKESTRKPGQIYDVVEVDGQNLNVRYSGTDARLEKFSILPESSSEFLPDANWNVEVIKDEQPSRFYYKVTYKAE